MAKIFLDANCVIDLVEHRKEIRFEDIKDHLICISPLSIHILVYLYKYKVPNQKLSNLEKYIQFIPFDAKIAHQAALGPTPDFEDNVQLHSAAEAECDFFLTSDQKLLDMTFFGKMRITHTLSPTKANIRM